MALTEIQARNAKPKDKPYPLAVGKGLRLLVKPNGSKLWQHRYRFEGEARMLSYGSYPTVTVKEAGEKRDAARKLLADKIDPSAARKAEKRERRVRASQQLRGGSTGVGRVEARRVDGRSRRSSIEVAG